MKKLVCTLYLPLFLIANSVLASEADKLHIYTRPIAPTAVPVYEENGDAVVFAQDDSHLRVINFWALWCVSCRKEMPTIDALSESYAPEDIEFITVAVGKNDPAKIREFFGEIGVVNLPVYHDENQRYAASVGVRGLPHTIILNAKGEEVARIIGEANYLDPSIKAAFDRLLLTTK